MVCPCHGSTYNDLVQYQKNCLNDSEDLDTEQKLDCMPCARVFDARKYYFSHLKSSPSHDGNVRFSKALLNLSRANDADPGLSHPVLSRKPDFSVGQDIKERKEVKVTVKNPLRSAAPAAKYTTLLFVLNLHYRLSSLSIE
jgi:uncharacterized C2H2 Zn-finger protein